MGDQLNGGGTNVGGGLKGKVFGLGAPGNNGKNGMALAWDGKIDTWFDCVGPPDDFPDSECSNCCALLRLSTSPAHAHNACADI